MHSIIGDQVWMLLSSYVNHKSSKTPILLLQCPCSNAYEPYTDDIRQMNNSNYLLFFLQSIKRLLVALNLYESGPKSKNIFLLI